MSDATSNQGRTHGEPPHSERLYELLAGERLASLSPEEAAELEVLRAALGSDTSVELDADAERAVGELLVMLDQAGADQSDPPEALLASLTAQGRAMIAGSALPQASSHAAARPETSVMKLFPPDERGRSGRDGAGLAWMLFGIAATLAAVVSVGLWYNATQQSTVMQRTYEQRLAEMSQRIDSNNAVLARARSRATELEAQLAEGAQREIEIAQRLASATQSLTEAELTIARYETPVDPGVLKFNREKLLELPTTLVRGWAPFDLPDAPAEQRGRVQGDVAWNNELQTGYLRFVGLKVNDPLVEQYQVWVIDERGLEQKVSGGVFDANADGEVIVPIEPGIDVGRVALFAITIEAPGGTWVPDLERRVVVAPVDEG